jgi:predicted RNase H-like nuclease (RuvC/YqgF family)
MIEDHRITKLEADVEHLRTDVSEAKQDIRELQASVSGLRTELYDFRIEVSKDFGSVRTEMATRFGAVDVQLEALKTLVERNTRYMMVWGLSTLVGLVAMFGTVGHALKWF